jgi:hypothetical protein
MQKTASTMPNIVTYHVVHNDRVEFLTCSRETASCFLGSKQLNHVQENFIWQGVQTRFVSITHEVLAGKEVESAADSAELSDIGDTEIGDDAAEELVGQLEKPRQRVSWGRIFESHVSGGSTQEFGDVVKEG